MIIPESHPSSGCHSLSSDSVEPSRGSDVNKCFRGLSEVPCRRGDGVEDTVKLSEYSDSMTTINQALKDKLHPETDVPYRESSVCLPDGSIVTGVFPEFSPDVEVQLDRNDNNDYKGSRVSHEIQANIKLHEVIVDEPSLSGRFTGEQLQQIRDGETPDGYTWHHHEQPGRMQLVDSNTHRDTRHTGGYAIWGKQEEVKNV